MALVSPPLLTRIVTACQAREQLLHIFSRDWRCGGVPLDFHWRNKRGRGSPFALGDPHLPGSVDCVRIDQSANFLQLRWAIVERWRHWNDAQRKVRTD